MSTLRRLKSSVVRQCPVRYAVQIVTPFQSVPNSLSLIQISEKHVLHSFNIFSVGGPVRSPSLIGRDQQMDDSFSYVVNGSCTNDSTYENESSIWWSWPNRDGFLIDNYNEKRTLGWGSSELSYNLRFLCEELHEIDVKGDWARRWRVGEGQAYELLGM